MSTAVDRRIPPGSLHRRPVPPYDDGKYDGTTSAQPIRSTPIIGVSSKGSPNSRESRIATRTNKYPVALSPRNIPSHTPEVSVKSTYVVEESHDETNDTVFPSLSSQNPQMSILEKTSISLLKQKQQHCTPSSQLLSSNKSTVPMPYSRISNVGLKNLGNTCFMNSALQCILHIEPLISYFLREDFEKDINSNSPMKGSLASSFGELVKDMFSVKAGSSVNPSNFKRIVTKLAPHLLDYEQQDCQEFLRFLLDGLSDDLARKRTPLSMDDDKSQFGEVTLEATDMTEIKKRSEGEELGESPANSPIKPNHASDTISMQPRPPSEQRPSKQAANSEGSVTEPAIVETNSSGDSREPLKIGIEKPQFSARTVQRLRFLTSEASQAADSSAGKIPGRELQLLGTAGSRGNSSNQLSSSDDCIDSKPNDPTRRLSSSDGAATLATSRRHDEVSVVTAPARLDAAVIKGPSISDIARGSPQKSIGKSIGAGEDFETKISQSSSSGTMGTFRALQQRAKERRNTDNSTSTTVDKVGQFPTTSSITLAHVETAIKESEKAWTAYLAKNDSIITDIFGGQLQSSIECLTCHHRSLCFDPFLDLSIPIVSSGQEGSDSRWRGRDREPVKCSLHACLEEFSAVEVLEGDNAYNCEKCKAKRKCIKRLTIYKYPKVLVLHIKRFRYTTFRREKMSTDVDFPTTGLDISPFVSAELQSEHSDRSSLPPLYDLAGVAHHSGSMNGGHYIAHVDTKDHSASERGVGDAEGGPAEESAQHWVCFNDARTAKFLGRVISCGGSSSSVSNSLNILCIL